MMKEKEGTYFQAITLLLFLFDWPQAIISRKDSHVKITHYCENNIKKTKQMLLTGSLLKKTNEVRVKINHLFFQDVHPIPAQVGLWNSKLRSKVKVLTKKYLLMYFKIDFTLMS